MQAKFQANFFAKETDAQRIEREKIKNKIDIFKNLVQKCCNKEPMTILQQAQFQSLFIKLSNRQIKNYAPLFDLSNDQLVECLGDINMIMKSLLEKHVEEMPTYYNNQIWCRMADRFNLNVDTGEPNPPVHDIYLSPK